MAFNDGDLAAYDGLCAAHAAQVRRPGRQCGQIHCDRTFAWREVERLPQVWSNMCIRVCCVPVAPFPAQLNAQPALVAHERRLREKVGWGAGMGGRSGMLPDA